MTAWNPPSARPAEAGVYRVLSDGLEGFALWDLDIRAWGCTQPTAELAASEPEFFWASQEKNWAERVEPVAEGQSPFVTWGDQCQ